MISKKLKRAKANTRRKILKFRNLLKKGVRARDLEWVDTLRAYYGCAYCAEFKENNTCTGCPLNNINGEEPDTICEVSIEMPKETKRQFEKFLDFVAEENRKTRDVE